MFKRTTLSKGRKLKQALIVDPQGAAEEFAQYALVLYEHTTVPTMQEALALASCADYDLVLIAQHGGLCDGALWAMVERITRLASESALVMVQAENADKAFHMRASELGVTVIGAPLGIGVLAMINEATAG